MKHGDISEVVLQLDAGQEADVSQFGSRDEFGHSLPLTLVGNVGVRASSVLIVGEADGGWVRHIGGAAPGVFSYQWLGEIVDIFLFPSCLCKSASLRAPYQYIYVF